MGFAMKNLEYLSNKGYLKKKCTILDIGSQCLYHATPEAIRAFVEKYGEIKDPSVFDAEAKRISHFSWPRPGERTSYLSELLDLTPLEYTSFDVCPALKTEILDLNRTNLPEKYREHFDIVLNFGTTEHIINQINSFRVMHDALRPGGIFFHQLPSIGYTDHGYFCYHQVFFSDLANANDYEMVDVWYTLAGQASLAGSDIRDAETPEVSQSGLCKPGQLTIPSFNINVVMRKRVSRPFAVGLELATSHAVIANEVACLYDGGGQVSTGEKTAVPSLHCLMPNAVPTISGRELLKELGFRIARRLGAAGKVFSPPTNPSQRPSPTLSAHQVLPDSVLATLTTQIVEPDDPSLNAMSCVEKGKALLAAMEIAKAVGYFNRALAIVHQFPYAVVEMKRVSEIYAAGAADAWAKGQAGRALAFSVAAIEADPKNPVPRNLLAKIEDGRIGQDITHQCFVSSDPERALTVQREAIHRSLEYVSNAGVIGDVMEFGVLGGWSARIFAETMRDLMVMGNLHLYDSFTGLPACYSPVDQSSYEIGGRNLWADKMRFPDEFVAALGGSLEKHIEDHLSHVIRRERIKMHPGFYAETLKHSPSVKAALVHIDCDLYQSACEVLDGLFRHQTLQDGCVLMFDDWNCNKANPHFGERRAFREFLERQQRFTSSDFFTYGFNGAAFILHEAGT